MFEDRFLSLPGIVQAMIGTRFVAHLRQPQQEIIEPQKGQGHKEKGRHTHFLLFEHHNAVFHGNRMYQDVKSVLLP